MTEFRFYAELGDFLPQFWRGRSFEHAVNNRQSVKHVIEALGVPHTEIGLLLINGEAAGLDCQLGVNDRVAVLPVLRHLMLSSASETYRFAADAHLGRLARYLRFSGFDTLWDNAWDDAELAGVASREGRVVLTRDRALLMYKVVLAGCYLRDKEPLAQLADVASRYALDVCGVLPGRCLECNALLEVVTKNAVMNQLLPGTLAGFDEFWLCSVCRRVFWRGSHWKRMRGAVDAVARSIGVANPVCARS